MKMTEARNEPRKIETEEDAVQHLRRLLRGAEEEREALRGVQACDHARRQTRAVRIKKGKLARENYRAYVEVEARKAAKARKSGEAKNRPRCFYCGNVYLVDSSGYCLTCRKNGLDSVHKETGRTNGWDRPATVKVKAVGGWRGRPVAGRSIRGDMTVLLDDAP